MIILLVVNLVICISLGLLYIYMVVSHGFDFVFSVLVKRLAAKSIAEMTYFVTTTTVLRPFFQDHPGEPMPEENFWTLWCKGRLTEADTPTIRLGVTPSGLTSAHLHHPPIFYRLDALPATQPTV